MAESNLGILARIVATFKRWLSSDDGRVAVPTPALPIAILPPLAAVAPPAASPAASRAPSKFALAARLHSVARLNPRKDRVKAYKPGRKGKPMSPQRAVTKQSNRETRHVWLRTRAPMLTPRPSTATLLRLPAAVAASPARAPLETRRAA